MKGLRAPRLKTGLLGGSGGTEKEGVHGILLGFVRSLVRGRGSESVPLEQEGVSRH